MGESQNQPFQLAFNRFLRVDFQGSRVTSDGGLILVRELDERFGLCKLIGEYLLDSRTGRNRQFPLADLLRQSVYSRLKAAGSPLSPVIAQFPYMQYLNGDQRVILN